MAIVWRYLTVLLVLAMLAWIVRHLLTRRQQRAVHEMVSLVAKILLIVAAVAVIWACWTQWGNR